LSSPPVIVSPRPEPPNDALQKRHATATFRC
jgi:hypothetical protein